MNDSAVRFYKRLNNFYYQFQSIGNNYNQVVHAINRGFTEQSARLLLARLIEQTRDLKRLSEQILALAKEFNERFNADGSENNNG